MPFIKRPAHPTLHYRVDDYTDPWTLPATLVLQHGYARSSQFWYSWVPQLARRYKIVRMDLRGHGESGRDFDPATGSRLEDYVSDVCALLDRLDLGPVHFCGESFGGVVGMVLAAEHPHRVKALSVVSSPVYQNASAAYSAGFPDRYQALRTLGAAKWAKAIYGAPDFFPPGTDPRLREWYVGEIAKNDVEVLCGLYSLVSKANVNDYLPRIGVPVLGLYPTAGSLTSSEQEELLLKGIRDFRMIHLPTSLHAVLTIEPDTCTRHLLDFLAERGASAT